MAYNNPLHPVYDASLFSSDLVLVIEYANGGGRDSRRVLPSLVKPSTWENTFATDKPLANPVSFRCTNSGTEGIPLWCFFRGLGDCMVAPSDAVLTGVKSDSIEVRFQVRTTTLFWMNH
jgi:hypothetical protein